jgi:hypothetical protein
VKGVDKSFRLSLVSWLISKYVPSYEDWKTDFSINNLGCSWQLMMSTYNSCAHSFDVAKMVCMVHSEIVGKRWCFQQIDGILKVVEH